ncbi:hypothetical protein [Methylobacterium sp. E-066]|uniref:hypothetical protein n=1 Tax=Methylobacterium sp. E-066 TaxID=2836584 RepID=UPI001FBC05BF|nr:hypothetical protein [Methylobacterium sp. E-066]MCJ2144309.1 hypothetical protein [Methylobacterium sp. E-066]
MELSACARPLVYSLIQPSAFIIPTLAVNLRLESVQPMLSRTRRSFSVEIKSAGRGQAAVIPSRVAPPAAKAPRLFRDPFAEPTAPPSEPRRILPSLIAPELRQFEPEPAAKDRPQERRGRPRKASAAMVATAAVEPVSAPPAPAAATAEPVARSQPTIAPTLTKRTAKSNAAIPPGERWKRRLGRWAR